MTTSTAAGETATQLLHRPTSYEPGRDWTEPVDDPRVLHDLQVNDLARLHDVEGLPAGVYRWPGLAAPVHPGAPSRVRQVAPRS
jgi:hypothetical protein